MLPIVAYSSSAASGIALPTSAAVHAADGDGVLRVDSSAFDSSSTRCSSSRRASSYCSRDIVPAARSASSSAS
jgi:hypothetical protein